MTLHNPGRSKEAVERRLKVLADNSAHSGIRDYAGAIGLYAQDIDRTWPAG
jgi:hypothetical protein